MEEKRKKRKEDLTYRSWQMMKDRCTNPKSPNYKNYGGRGIVFTSDWADYNVFKDDMGERPSTDYSLDRINNDGNYSPDNCRWATREEQNNNRRSSRILDFGGRSMSVSQWARSVGIKEKTLYARINDHGWTVSKALSKPKRGSV
jgi:hypothetical protein